MLASVPGFKVALGLAGNREPYRRCVQDSGPRRRGEYERTPLPRTLFRDEVEDCKGAFVVVETRKLRRRTYETSIAPGDAPDPDGPEVAVASTVHTRSEAAPAHQRAVDFAVRALKPSVRRLE